MGFWDTVGKLAEKGMDAASERASQFQEAYDKYYEWASRQSDEKLKREWVRKKASPSSNFRYLAEKKALIDMLHERGYGNQ